MVELAHRCVLHELERCRAHLALLRADVRIQRVRPEIHRGHDKLADLVGTFHRGEERDSGAERIADDVRLLQPEVIDERPDVVSHEPDVDGPIDVGRAAVSLEVDRGGLVALAQRGKDRPDISPEPSPPCTRIIGRPVPWVRSTG